MGIFSKLNNTVPDDTVGRILTRNPNVIKIEQIKERNVKYMPWLSSKKTTVFHFQPEPASLKPSPPQQSSVAKIESAIVEKGAGTVTTTQVTTLAIEDGKGNSSQELWFNVSQYAGTILAVAGVAAASGKKAYDLYQGLNNKKE